MLPPYSRPKQIMRADSRLGELEGPSLWLFFSLPQFIINSILVYNDPLEKNISWRAKIGLISKTLKNIFENLPMLKRYSFSKGYLVQCLYDVHYFLFMLPNFFIFQSLVPFIGPKESIDLVILPHLLFNDYIFCLGWWNIQVFRKSRFDTFVGYCLDE